MNETTYTLTETHEPNGGVILQRVEINKISGTLVSSELLAFRTDRGAREYIRNRHNITGRVRMTRVNHRMKRYSVASSEPVAAR